MNNRLVYRVIIKVMVLSAILVLALVFFNSLFTAAKKQENTLASKTLVELDTSGMKTGDIRKSYWEGKEIAVLLREDNTFFVYINIGDSRNCPLFKEKRGFKDVCTGTRFDLNGRQKGNEEHGFKITIPPFHFINENLIIGAKKTIK